MSIEEAKNWLASIEVHSETEASYKELILSTLEENETELKETKANEYECNNIISDLLDEMKKKDNTNERLLRKLRNRIKEVKKLEKYSLYKQEFSTLNKQLKEAKAEAERYFETTIRQAQKFDAEVEKKNKIMQAMAEEILIKRAWSLTGSEKGYQEETEELKDRIIKEYEEKVENGD